MRTQAAAALRTYREKTEQRKSGTHTAAEITMDPDVVEMTSTAWIDRSIATNDAEESPVAPLKDAKPVRKAPSVSAAVANDYVLPSIELLEIPVGPHEQAEDRKSTRLN